MCPLGIFVGYLWPRSPPGPYRPQSYPISVPSDKLISAASDFLMSEQPVGIGTLAICCRGHGCAGRMPDKDSLNHQKKLSASEVAQFLRFPCSRDFPPDNEFPTSRFFENVFKVNCSPGCVGSESVSDTCGLDHHQASIDLKVTLFRRFLINQFRWPPIF